MVGKGGALQDDAVAKGAPTVDHDAAFYTLHVGRLSEFWNHSH